MQVVSQFGEFSSDGQTMKLIQERKDSAPFQSAYRQFRKC
jgi:hypothetical protein